MSTTQTAEQSSLLLLLKNMLFMMASNMGAVLLSFGISWLMARQLGDNVYGQYVFVLGIANLVIAFADFGLQKVIMRELAKHRTMAGAWFFTILALRITVHMIASLLLLVLIPILDDLQGLETIAVIITYTVVATVMADTLRGVFVAFEKMQYDLITRLVERVLSLVLVAAVFLAGYSLFSATIALAVGSIIGLIITLWFVLRLIPLNTLKFNRDVARQTLRMGIPMGLSVLIVSFYARYDVLVLGVLRSTEEVAWFSIAYTLVLILISFSFSAANALFPVFARMSQQENKTQQLEFIRNLVRYVLVIAMLVAIGVFFTARLVIGTVYGAEYLPSADALRILSFSLVFLFPTHFMLILLLSENHQRLVLVGHSIAAITLFIIDPILISWLGINGAAWTNVMVEGIIFTYYLLLIRRLIGPIGMATLARPLITGLLLVAVYVLFLTSLPDLVNLVILLVLFISSVIITRTITLDDLVQLRKLVRR